VHETVMAAAEQHEILECRLTAARPVADVVRVDEPAVLATWEATPAVSRSERAA